MLQVAGDDRAAGSDRAGLPATRLFERYGSIRYRLLGLRHARRARWRLLSSCLAPVPRSSLPLRCAVPQLEEYASALARLSSYAGTSRSSPINRESLQRLIAANRSSSGAIGIPDLLFLHAFVTAVAPARVVELGTLTGFSAAVIAAAAAAQQQAGGSGTIVDTIDLKQWCLTDPTKPVGFEIAQLVPELTERVRVHPEKDSRHLGDFAREGEVGLAFIDADHQHPRPTLDLLRVAPFVVSEGWVLLHDIELGRITAEMRAAGVEPEYQPSYGAQWLFEAWPFAKVSGGNIGAVQLPRDLRELVPLALALGRIPSELKGVAAQRAAEALLGEAGKLVGLRR